MKIVVNTTKKEVYGLSTDSRMVGTKQIVLTEIAKRNGGQKYPRPIVQDDDKTVKLFETRRDDTCSCSENGSLRNIKAYVPLPPFQYSTIEYKTAVNASYIILSARDVYAIGDKENVRCTL